MPTALHFSPIAGTLRSVFGPLVATLVRALRLIGAFWPALIAWIIVGNLGRYVVIEFAGWVGFHNSMAGLVLMPFAVLSQLVALVAMLLVVRPGMPQLMLVAPVPLSARERGREFVDSLLVGILPFFAFYLAWGFLRQDMVTYSNRIFEIGQTHLSLEPGVVPNDGSVDLTWFTGVVIAIALVIRFALRRLSSRSSRVVPILAVYVEALWVFLSTLIIGSIALQIKEWVFSRQGVAWFDGADEWIADRAAPIGWLLQSGGWMLGELSGLIVYPLAWLTIAGVVYGQTIDTPTRRPRLVDRIATNLPVSRFNQRLAAAPNWVRSRLRELGADVTARVRPVWDAIRLMWHVGPLVIAGFVLMFQGYQWVQAALDMVIPRLFGPHDYAFWELYSPAIFLIAPVVTAPIVIGIIGSTFDTVLARARHSDVDPAAGSIPDPEPPNSSPVKAGTAD